MTPLSTFHISAVPSALEDANCVPSGLKTTHVTQSECPRKVRTPLLEYPFHSLMAESAPPEARFLPTGLNATDLTGAVCPLKTRLRKVLRLHRRTVVSS